MCVAAVYDNDLWVFGGVDGATCLDTAEVTLFITKQGSLWRSGQLNFWRSDREAVWRVGSVTVRQ